MNTHNFFSKRNLDGVNPDDFLSSLQLANLNMKLDQFRTELESAAKFETREAVEAEYWLNRFNTLFELNNGKV